MKVHYDLTSGEIKGFYPVDIEYAVIPEPTIEIDEATHMDCINNPGKRRVDLTALQIAVYDPAPTLTEVVAAKLAELKASRNAAESATPFAYDGSQFDYDALSRERINAAVSAATIAAVSGTATTAVICEWTLYDNSKRQMTVGDWLAFRAAEVARSAECHSRYNTLKAQVEAATTAADVNAVAW